MVRDKADAKSVARIFGAESVARIFGCTAEQAKAQYRKNAAQLREMAAHPKRANGAKFEGITADELLRKAAEFDEKGRE